MIKKIVLCIISLAILAGIAGFYYYQKNIYSKGDIRLEILGPEEATLMDEVEYVVKYRNNGNTNLEEPSLVFEYPDNSVPSTDQSLRVTKGREDLGEVIYPGEEKTFHFSARLLGKEGSIKEAKAYLSYRPKNLKASYQSETTLATIIKKVPLTFEFDLPSKNDSGKDFKLRINYFSNLNIPISGLRVSVDYPAGFEFIESVPAALEKTEWDIGILNKAQGGRIEVTGRLEGEVNEEKLFHAQMGIWQDGEFIVLKEASEGMIIVKPSIYISQLINGSPRYVARPGDMLHYQIFFKNLGEEMLTNLFLIAKLEGDAFDFSTMKAPEGDFAAGDNSVVFDWKTIPKLQFLDGGEEGGIDFWVELKKEWPMDGIEDKNLVIKNKILLGQSKEEFINKVNSLLVITQKGYFNDEIFGNTGPTPLQVNQPTTFSITWQAKNYFNDVNNIKVKANLAENVELTGKIFPEDQASKFSYDARSKEVVWTVGDLKASQGASGTSAPNISFQIKLTPTIDQRNTAPELIGVAKVTGEDMWTGELLTSTSTAISTVLPDDTSLSNDKKIVQ